VVSATRYPPRGERGVGTAFARGARWNGIGDYVQRHADAVSIIVQIESRKGLDALAAIVKVDGIDAVFLGPADLAASLGYPGQPAHPEVRRQIENAIAVASQSGDIVGVNAFDYDTARHYESVGARLLLIGADVTLLASGSRALLERYRSRERNDTESP
jgi:4-hydroxy-2-oxoheptanedioate aldolase